MWAVIQPAFAYIASTNQSFTLPFFFMQRTIGIILTVIGAIATLITGVQALQDSDSFSLFGVDIAVSSANWTPLIISVAVLIIGIVMMRSPQRT